LSIAPAGEQRSKAALLAEAEIGLAERWTAIGGLRVDHVRETIGTVLSPRAALRFKPRPDQTLRAAWGRAFRSPSVIESDLFVPVIPVAILDWEEIDRILIEQGLIDPAVFPDGFLALMVRGVCETTPDNCGVPAGVTPNYTATTAALGGGSELDEEVTDSIELGYAARLGPYEVSAAVYRTRSRGGIDFPQLARYGVGADGEPGTADDVVLPADPERDGIEELPSVDACPFGLDTGIIPPFGELCAEGPVPFNQAMSILLDGQIPAAFGYRNSASTANHGVELGLGWHGRRGVSARIAYSWQHEPQSDGVAMSDRIDGVIAETASGEDLDGDGAVADTTEFVNIPAEHRLSLVAGIDRKRWHASAGFDFVDETFWQDVLTPDFWGWVDGYTLVGLRGGYRWPGVGAELTAQVTNLLDEPIQQHIFGDIIDRRASVGLAWRWGGDDAVTPAGPVAVD
jgi:outer membrane receptor protein involved in Fe transport